MIAYPDTGFLCSVYSADANTPQALHEMNCQTEPLPWTWLHQIEFRNALRLRVFRSEIDATQRDKSLNLQLADLASGLFSPASVPLESLLLETERLSSAYVESIGTRSPDILHVAMASLLGCRVFITSDKRQAALVPRAGLTLREF